MAIPNPTSDYYCIHLSMAGTFLINKLNLRTIKRYQLKKNQQSFFSLCSTAASMFDNYKSASYSHAYAIDKRALFYKEGYFISWLYNSC